MADRKRSSHVVGHTGSSITNPSLANLRRPTLSEHVRISESRRSIKADTTETHSLTSITALEVQRKSHKSSEFIRGHSLTDNCWKDRQSFLWCCILVGTNNAIFPIKLDLLLLHSGGAFIIIFILTMMLFGIPMTYMELFMGRYTRMSNCQMYRMAPIFFGFCITVYLMNFFYQPLQVSEDSQVLVNFLKLIVDSSVNDKCVNDVDECYDYDSRGPIKSNNCESISVAFICDNKTYRYKMQYQYWTLYKNKESGLYPYWQMVTAVTVAWGIILSVTRKGLRLLGLLVKYTFIFYASVLTWLLIIALLNGGAGGFQIIFTADTSRITWQTLAVMVWMALYNCGLIFPTGYMTSSAYTKIESDIYVDSFIIILGNTFFTFYYIVVHCAIIGVIAKLLEVPLEAVVITGRGVYLALVPEMLIILHEPNIYLVAYYASNWLFETMKTALYIHLLVLNLFDYFPINKKYEIYIWIIICTILCLLSVIFCNQNVYIYFVPTFWLILTLYGYGFLLAAEASLVSYFYGVTRFCDDIYFVTGIPPSNYWKALWYITPTFYLLLASCMAVGYSSSKYGIYIKQRIFDDWFYGYVYYGSMIFIALIATMFSISIRIEKPNLLLYLLKPQFYWGAPDKDTRKRRKVFFPRSYIRSQQTDISEEYILTDKSYKASCGDEIPNILNDKIFFTSIGIYSDIPMT